MVYKAVIFDLDGTLVHTSPEYRYLVVGRVLDKLGVKYSEADIDRFWFQSGRNVLINDRFGINPNLFWPVYKEHDTKELREQFAQAYPDVDFIRELRENAFKLGIVTGAPEHIARLEIGMLGEENFDEVIIAKLVNNIMPKPHPQGLEMCLNSLGVKKNEAIYVGNADEDIEAARTAGVFDVLLDRGEYTFPNLSPSLTIQSLYDLREFLDLN